MSVEGLRSLGMILCCSLSLLKPAWPLFAARCQVSVVLPPFFLRAWSELPSGQSLTLSGQQTPTLGSSDHIAEPTHWSSSSPDSPILPTGVVDPGPQEGESVRGCGMALGLTALTTHKLCLPTLHMLLRSLKNPPTSYDPSYFLQKQI